MNGIRPPSLGVGEVLFPVLSFGTLLTAFIIFAFLAMHKRDAPIYWSMLALLFGSVLAVGLDAAVLLAGGVLGEITTAMKLYRLYELSVTAFAVTVPYTLWAVLSGGRTLRPFTLSLIGIGAVATTAAVVVAFAAPELFVSVSEQSTGFGTAYSTAIGRGSKGVLFAVRDVYLAVLALCSVTVGITGIVRRHITGTNTLIVTGLLLGTLSASTALHANFIGSYPGPLAQLPFSRVSLAITLFTVTATAAYVLRYVRQSRALDEANHELEHRRDRLIFLAYHNDLTQMPNKQALIRDIDALFAARAGGTGNVSGNGNVSGTGNVSGNGSGAEHFAEAFICDLDSFDSVEDSYGFSFSVALLRVLGRRIRTQVTCGGRLGGTIYHIEGARFAILVPRPLGSADRDRMERLLLREISAPISVDSHEVFLSAGIGHYSVAADAGDAEEVLRRLKRGLAAAAESGSRVGRYSPDIGAQIEASQRLVQELRQAIRKEDFHVHYQPIVDRDGRVRSTEALLRWDTVDTERFIALAEQSGLIVPVTDFVVRTVCADLVHLRTVIPDIAVHINISARHITQIGFPATLAACLSGRGLDPASIRVEITETSFLHHDAEVAAILRRLTADGFAVAIDDFGTGYSSMTYLKRIPASTLKIDRSFVRELPHRREDRALVYAMITLAHDLGKLVVAEGVETAEQADYLLDAGIDSLQGYYYGRPLPRDQFLESMAAVSNTPTGMEL